MIQTLSILKKNRPAVVVGTGGYVSGPVLMAASMMHIPTIIHEQNSVPGATTRSLGKRVSEVHLSFEESRRYFSRTDNLFVSGNPTRDSLDGVDKNAAYKYFGFPEKEPKKTVLVFGGSLGARTINNAVAKSIGGWISSGLRIIWQTGKEEYERLSEQHKRYSSGALWIGEFIDTMEYAYALSNLVVCRAGATTIAELTRLGKPSILIPYPFAAANHQVENARMLEACGAAKIMYDHEAEKVMGTIVETMIQDNASLERMSGESKKLGKPGAAQVIVSHILSLMDTKKQRH